MNKNKSFDSQVRKKLGEISTQPSYGAWDTFHQKLNSDIVNPSHSDDSKFDAALKSKLKQISRYPVPTHWEKLKYRLETIEIFKQKIIVNKMKEALAILLFLFTFYNITTHILPKEMRQGDMYVDDLQEIKESQNLTIADDQKTNTSVHFNELKNNFSKDNFAISRSSLVSQSVQNNQNDFFASNEIQQDELYIIPVNTFSDNSEQIEFIPTLDSREIIATQALPSLRVSGLEIQTNIIPLKLAKKQNSISENRVGLYVSYVNNFILTPYDKVYALPKFSNSTTSKEYGVTFGKKIKNLELESGIGYTKLRYTPSQISETFSATGNEYLETSLQGIEFDFVKIPLNAKYFVVDNSNWKIYGLAGASLQILAQAEYDISENIKKGQPLVQNRFTSDGHKLDEKPFTTGFLDEGKLSGNYFIDLHLGFGVERKITERLNLYIQPAYHTFVLSDRVGIGPNNDKLNSFHIQTGVKFSLN